MEQMERVTVQDRLEWLKKTLPTLARKSQLLTIVKQCTEGVGFDMERDKRTNTKSKLVWWMIEQFKHSEICWWMRQNTSQNIHDEFINTAPEITGKHLIRDHPDIWDKVMGAAVDHADGKLPGFEITGEELPPPVDPPGKADPDWPMKDWEEKQGLRTPPPPAGPAAGIGGLFEQMILDIINKSPVNPAVIAGLVKDEISKQKPRIQTVVVTPAKERRTIKGTTHQCFARVLELSEERIPVFLTGPAGCGKTFLAEQIAEAMSLNYSETSCNGGMNAEDFFGRLLPTGDDGKFEYHTTPMLEAVENGGVHCFDELDATPADIRFSLQSLFAKRECFLPARIGAHHLKAHPDFVGIATGNSYGQGGNNMYQREIADAAAHDRFRAGTVQLDYDNALEKELIRPDVLAWGLEIREKIISKRMERVLSTRVMIDYSRMMDRFPETWTRKTIENSYFVDWSEDECRQIGRQA